MVCSFRYMDRTTSPIHILHPPNGGGCAHGEHGRNGAGTQPEPVRRGRRPASRWEGRGNRGEVAIDDIEATKTTVQWLQKMLISLIFLADTRYRWYQHSEKLTISGTLLNLDCTENRSMRLIDIKIENFRGLRSLHLPFDALTVLIGENNVGKSTVLEAIRLVLTRAGGRRDRFTEYDFHLTGENALPQAAEPILITLHFAEKEENEWPNVVTQQLGDVIQLEPNSINHIWLQARGVFQADRGVLEKKWTFLNTSGDELVLKNSSPFNSIARLMPLFFLSALRDASQEFGTRGQFWNGFLKSIQLPDKEREEIEEMLKNANNAVVSANSGLTEVTQRIANVNHHVSLAATDPVVLEAIPTRVFDMAGKIQVHLKSQNGAKLPLGRHGEGTQSLAVLMLFQAFAATNLAETYAPESTPLLVLEEPEAHLHPSAIRSLGTFLKDMTGQIVVASHSGDLVSRVPVTALRRIYKRNGETKVGQVRENSLTDREQQAIDYSIRLTKGYHLFSRCWLLVEGQSDFHLMPLLFDIMGYSQDQSNISVLEISQVCDKGEPFMKLANALGIPWFLMADGDKAGSDYIDRANRHTSQGIADTQKLNYIDIEHEFWHSGFNDFIEDKASANRKSNAEPSAENDQVKETIKAAIDEAGGKPAFARELAGEVGIRGKDSIPQLLQDIINRVIKLAEN